MITSPRFFRTLTNHIIAKIKTKNYAFSICFNIRIGEAKSICQPQRIGSSAVKGGQTDGRTDDGMRDLYTYACAYIHIYVCTGLYKKKKTYPTGPSGVEELYIRTCGEERKRRFQRERKVSFRRDYETLLSEHTFRTQNRRGILSKRSDFLAFLRSTMGGSATSRNKLSDEIVEVKKIQQKTDFCMGTVRLRNSPGRSSEMKRRGKCSGTHTSSSSTYM